MGLVWVQILDLFFKIFYLFVFREKGRDGEREGEKHQCMVASRTPPTGDLARNPGMCSHWESNQQPFGSQASTPYTEPHQPGLTMGSYKLPRGSKIIYIKLKWTI